ncbi:hypothetical protein L209DRAFT_484489 [Thermothelomyces heterothallicus CBS 203.75]
MTTYIPSLTLPDAVFNNVPASILLPIALGSAVGYATRPATNRQESLALNQPPLRPPAAVFPPVWTTLYGLMGYAAHRAFSLGTSPFNSPVRPTPFSLVPFLPSPTPTPRGPFLLHSLMMC